MIKLTPVTAPLLPVIAAHGLTDLARPKVACVHYATWCFAIPLSRKVTTCAFCAASVFHLSFDLGPFFSTLLHAAVAIIAWVSGNDVAFNAFMYYFALIHVPLHYLREYRKGNRMAVLLPLCLGFSLMPLGPKTFLMTDSIQKLIIAHISATSDWYWHRRHAKTAHSGAT